MVAGIQADHRQVQDDAQHALHHVAAEKHGEPRGEEADQDHDHGVEGSLEALDCPRSRGRLAIPFNATPSWPFRDAPRGLHPPRRVMPGRASLAPGRGAGLRDRSGDGRAGRPPAAGRTGRARRSRNRSTGTRPAWKYGVAPQDVGVGPGRRRPWELWAVAASAPPANDCQRCSQQAGKDDSRHRGRSPRLSV